MSESNKKVRKEPLPKELEGQIYLSPKYDPAFKELFDSEIALKDFLNGALGLNGDDEIKEISFTFDENLNFRTPERKKVIFDIFATTESKRHIDIEMQKVEHGYFVDRAVLYNAFLTIKGRQDYENSEEYKNLSKGERKLNRYKLPECVSIWICDFDLPEVGDVYADEWTLYSRHSIDCGNPASIFPKNKYLLYSLKNFKKPATEVDGPLEEWLYLMNHADDGDELPDFGNTAIKEALERIKVDNANDDFLRSQADSMSMKEDLEIVLAQAQLELEKAKREAKQAKLEAKQAKREAKQEIARKMLAQHMPIQNVADFLGLTLEEVNAL